MTDVFVPASLTDATTGLPQIARTQAATVRVRLQNATGADVALAAGGSPATFAVKLPYKLFSTTEIAGISTATAGWAATPNPTAYTVSVACTQAGTWANGAWLEFDLQNVLSAAQPQTGLVTIGLSGMTGPNLPLSTSASLSIVNPPAPGDLPLDEVLQVSLDDQGSVYVSTAADPLQSMLELNLKNIGDTALATDPALPGNPQVQITFVTGNTSGALAPDDSGNGTPPAGSIWNVKLQLGPSGTAWSGQSPTATPGATAPEWLLWPTKSNPQILGPRASDTANASFSFSPVTSFTPAGHTQMIVLCTGFRKSATQGYQDHTYVLDIVKQTPPPTRGLLSYYGTEPLHAVPLADRGKPVTLELRWGMLGVASVRLVTSRSDIPNLHRTYPQPKPLAYDRTTLTFSPPNTSEPVFTTLQAFDGNGRFLNGLQFAAYVQVDYIRDPAGRYYPVAQFGDRLWMLENYDFDPSGGSWVYDPSQESTFGRLYDWGTAQAQAPDGWALPTPDDWQALIELFGGSSQAYAALLAGGTSGWNAQLGGQRSPQPGGGGTFSDQYSYGYYWSGNGGGAQFSSNSASVTLMPRQDAATGFSVRYVQHA